jgi:hypothetical protein
MRLDAADRVLEFVSEQHTTKHTLTPSHRDDEVRGNAAGNDNRPVTEIMIVAKN